MDAGQGRLGPTGATGSTGKTSATTTFSCTMLRLYGSLGASKHAHGHGHGALHGPVRLLPRRGGSRLAIARVDELDAIDTTVCMYYYVLTYMFDAM